jgi:hypothetical protein
MASARLPCLIYSHNGLSSLDVKIDPFTRLDEANIMTPLAISAVLFSRKIRRIDTLSIGRISGENLVTAEELLEVIS